MRPFIPWHSNLSRLLVVVVVVVVVVEDRYSSTHEHLNCIFKMQHAGGNRRIDGGQRDEFLSTTDGSHNVDTSYMYRYVVSEATTLFGSVQVPVPV